MKTSIKYSLIGVFTFVLITLSCFGFYFSHIQNKVGSDDPVVWEEDIKDFEKHDKKFPPSSNSILFLGSSSINYWKTLAEDMHPLPVINRGFGGAKINDVTYYAPRIIFPYKPNIIVLYAGDNDMSVGRVHNSKDVLKNYKKFVAFVHNSLPDTKIYFISIKPTIGRWEYWPDMVKANALIKHFSETHTNLGFIDVSTSMLENGLPRKDIISLDGIHMNNKGYEIWTSIIKPLLQNSLAN